MSFALAAAMMLASSNCSVTVRFRTGALGPDGYNVVTMALEEGFRRFDTAEVEWWHDQQIRLVGNGACRFHIQKILHNGYGGDSLPFVVVEAILLNDNHSAFVSDEGRLNLERNLWDKATKMNTDRRSSSWLHHTHNGVNGIGVAISTRIEQ
jgi:hypothetical protein